MASLDFIPGIREAEAKFKEELIEAFAGVEPDICGAIEVRPFTPQMFIELSGCGNGFFLQDKRVTEIDVAVFLWRVSKGFDRKAKKNRKKFNEFVSVLPFEQCVFQILDYIKRAWWAMPQWPGSPDASPSAGVWPSRIVDLLACEYGWTEEYTLNLPFRRLWQYVNRILERNVKDYTHKCPQTLALRDKWLKEQNTPQEAPIQAQ